MLIIQSISSHKVYAKQLKCMVFYSRRQHIFRVFINSIFGVFYSSCLSQTPVFCKVSIEKYSKTPTFSRRQHFYAPPPESGGVLCYTLRNFECPSVRLSVRPSIRQRPPPFLYRQLLLQFQANPFETLQVF